MINHPLPRRTFLRGLGATLALADARLDDAAAVGARSVHAAHPSRLRLHAERHRRGVRQEPAPVHVDAENRRRELRVQPDDEGARAVPRPDQRVERPGASDRAGARRRPRRPRPRDGDVPHRRASLQDRRRRLQAWRFSGPDRGARAREVHAAGVARARAGAAAARRQLRLRLHLRLHVDVVARTEQSAAGGDQSARGVRAPVRRRRQHGSESPRVQARAAEKRARLRHRQPVAAAAEAEHRRQAEDRRVSSNRSATSNVASRSRRRRTRRWSSRIWSGRARCPTTTPSTRS